MKKTFSFIFIILLGVICFPQTRVQPKKSVTDFFTTVENYTKGYNRTNEKELFKSKNYSKEEALSLAKQYSKAEAEDPVGLNSYERKKMKEFEEKFKKNGHWVWTNELMFADKVGIISKIISSYYGRTFTRIIAIPWYLKFHVLNIKQGKFKTSINGRTVVFRKTYLVAEVEDVIKGKNFFKQGDTVEINFLNQWMWYINKHFEKNTSYFAGLREWDCYKIALDMFPDKDNGIYPIENGNVVAPDNFFGIKNSLKWSEFKNKFEKKYILFEE